MTREWERLIGSALANGVVMSLVLAMLGLVGGRIARDMFVSNYPPDIREAFGPMSPRAARIRPYFASVVFASVVVVPLVGLWRLAPKVGPIGFWHAFTYGATALSVFNVIDLLLLDWLFFCTIQPRAMALPGTEGMAGYRDYRFHLVGFLKGIGFSIAGGVCVAVTWRAMQLLFV